MSLQSKHYVASPADVEALTRAVLGAAQTGIEGRTSYLRALVATTQAELGSPVRLRQVTAGKLSADELAGHLSALETVNGRFYATVLKAADAVLGAGKPRERNRRTNFARTSVSTVRTWIRAGNDITSLAASRVTKASLSVELRQRRVPSSAVLTRQTTRYAERLSKAAVALAGTDRVTARKILEAAMTQLSGLLANLAMSSGHDGHHTARVRGHKGQMFMQVRRSKSSQSRAAAG